MHKKYFKLILEGMIVEARYCIKLGIIGVRSGEGVSSL